MKSFKDQLLEMRMHEKVHHNISADKIKTIASTSRFKSVRFSIDQNNDLHVGDAGNFTHSELYPHGVSIHPNDIRGFVNYHDGHYHFNAWHYNNDERPNWDNKHLKSFVDHGIANHSFGGMNESVIPKEDYKLRFYGSDPELTHSREINGHKVDVAFSPNHLLRHDSSKPLDHTAVTVYVNGQTLSRFSGIHNEQDKRAIVHHVKHTVDSYIHHYNPKSINATGSGENDDESQRKNKAYTGVLKRMAKRHGGKIEHDEFGVDWHLRESYGEILPKEQFHVGLQGHVRHIAHIHGHKVDVTFGKAHSDVGHYGISYNINGYKDAKFSGVRDHEEKVAIGRHVASVVKSFVHHFNPSELHAGGVDIDPEKEKSKDRNYLKGFRKLSKQYGGKVYDADPGASWYRECLEEDYQPEHKPQDFRYDSAREMYVHSRRVGDNTVRVSFEKSHGNHYDVQTLVNGSMDKMKVKVDPHSASAISKHVKSVVGSFIHHFKPDSLEGISSDVHSAIQDRKANLYVRGFREIARQVGGASEPIMSGQKGINMGAHWYRECLEEDYTPKHAASEFEPSPQRTTYMHRKKIGPHKVLVRFDRDIDKKENSWTAKVRVNDSFHKDKSEVAPQDGLKINTHVKHVVGSFIHHFKPDSLVASATDTNTKALHQKANLYKRGMRELVKDVGGNHREKPPSEDNDLPGVEWYRECLEESYQPEHSADEFNHWEPDNVYTHRAQIGQHHILVDFAGDPRAPHKKDYTVNVEVNGKTSKGQTNVSPLYGHIIRNHVKNVVGSFIHHFRPDSLSGMAADVNPITMDRKAALYHRGFKEISRELGGKVRNNEAPGLGVPVLNWHKESLDEAFVPKHSKDEFFENSMKNNRWHHIQHVNGHEVKITFDPIGNHEYAPDVDVNNHISKRSSGVNDPNHGASIAHHVRNVVSSFVHHFKPNGIYAIPMDSDTDQLIRKRTAYKTGLKGLVTRFGGKIQGERNPEWVREWLDESSIINRLRGRLGDYVPKEEFQQRVEHGIYNHETKVHGHNVRVQFTPYRGAPKEYAVDFYVNGKTQKRQAHVDNPEHGAAIATHVGRVVSSFIHHFKPDVLDGSAADQGSVKAERAKQRLYRAGMQAIAQHHGGKVQDFPGVSTAYHREELLSFGNLIEAKAAKIKAIGQAQSQRTKQRKMGKDDLDIAFRMRKAGRSDEQIAAYFDMDRPDVRGQLYAAKDWNPNYVKAVNESVDYSKDSFQGGDEQKWHEANINGHKVVVGFEKTKNDAHDILVAVNHKVSQRSSGVKSAADKTAISYHIRKVVNAFRSHFNASKFTTSSSDEDEYSRVKKANVYASGLRAMGADVKKRDKYKAVATFREWLEESEDSYHGEHEAPDKEGGAPMHNVTSNGIYPDDFYSHKGFDYYSNHGEKHDYAAHSKVASMKGRPNAMIEVYRAVPKEVPRGTKINPGDWVTHTRSYAHEHGKSHLGGTGTYKILKKTVRANELYTDGNSIHEWGYHPTPFDKDDYKAKMARRKAREAENSDK